MKILTGSRYNLPSQDLGGDRPACKLDTGDRVRVTLRGFYKGWMCVGPRKVSCVFFKPVGDEPWVYCSKSRFLDVVKYLEENGVGFDDTFTLVYKGVLSPYTDADLEHQVGVELLAVQVEYGPTQGRV
jgi:hypothetical protein